MLSVAILISEGTSDFVLVEPPSAPLFILPFSFYYRTVATITYDYFSLSLSLSLSLYSSILFYSIDLHRRARTFSISKLGFSSSIFRA